MPLRFRWRSAWAFLAVNSQGLVGIPIPKYPIPVVRIGRLAVDKTAKGTGIGKGLLIDAFHRVLDAAKIIGIFAVVVDAKDETAKTFYKKYLPLRKDNGFIEFRDKPLVLFIAIATLKDALV